jgi:uncharacterized protein
MYSYAFGGASLGGLNANRVQFVYANESIPKISFLAECDTFNPKKPKIHLVLSTLPTVDRVVINNRASAFTLSTYVYVIRIIPAIKSVVDRQVIKGKFCSVNLNTFFGLDGTVVIPPDSTTITRSQYAVNKTSDSYTWRGFGFPLMDNRKISEKTDADLVADSVRQCILTQKGERVFRPNFGTKIKNLIFNNEKMFLYNDITSEILSSVSLNEPRASNIKVDLKVDTITNIIYADISFEYDGELQTIENLGLV